MDDASLDEFLDVGDGDGDDGGGRADSTAAGSDGGGGDRDDVDPTDDGAEPPVDPAGVGPATVTARWSSEGEACESCGETVRRRWVDEAGLVCAECKRW